MQLTVNGTAYQVDVELAFDPVPFLHRLADEELSADKDPTEALQQPLRGILSRVYPLG